MIAARDQLASARFAIGDLCISLRSDLPEVVADFAALYPSCQRGEADRQRVICMEIKQARRTLLGGKRYDVYGDGEAIHRDVHPDEVLPYLEWAINWRVVAVCHEYLQVHAATVARDGKGIVISGPSGAGKSTLAAGLLARGWTYLCDEFALINAETLDLHPYPKALGVKAGSFESVGRLGLKLSRDRHYIKALKGRVGYVSPLANGAAVAAAPCPVSVVILSCYTGAETPRARAILRGQAVFALARQTLTRHEFGARTVSILGRVVRNARCFALESGPIDETCDLIESLIE